ncbi:hypothetical protein FS749_008612 [Ceratobasidium sp. UAMH 11750]|nr:hypothetical protein FS749_008612 [Ceratobasidium sp. UAMH 11750]
MAGTGKTTIAYTLCERLEEENKLAASFFCTRQLPSCRDVGLILPTVAYQLASFSRPFQRILSGVLDRLPDAHTRKLSAQFGKLIVEPLREVKDSIPDGLVVVIDALDECDHDDGVAQILRTLLSHASELPIKFFVTSRPEPEIYDQMRTRTGRRERFELHLHELETSIVREDIKTYLRANLACADLPAVDVNRLANRSGVLFIYAATAVRYILGDNGSRSAKRLEAVLDASILSPTNVDKHIDALYTVILKGAFDEARLDDQDKREMRLVLHTVVCAQEPLTVDTMARLLGLCDADTARAALRHMLSVLNLQGANERVTTLHQSFPDYILDKSRSADFYCDAKEHNTILAQRCFDLMKVPDPPFNICNLDTSFLFDKNVPDLDEKVKIAIPDELFYSCRYWGPHLLLTPGAENHIDELYSWASARLFLWLEVMNLKQSLSAGTGMLSRVEAWLKRVGHGGSTGDLVQDAYAFAVSLISSPIPSSTPHIYLSALAFWPETRPVSVVYKVEMQGLIQPTGTWNRRRESAALVTCKVGSSVTCIAASPNGAVFASGCDDGTIRIWDAHTGQTIGKPLEGHTHAVLSVEYSSDSARIVSGSQDRTIRIWDARTGCMTGGPFKGHKGSVHSVAYSPNDAHIISGSGDNIVRIWNARTDKPIGEPLRGHLGEVNSVAYSPDGTSFASGSSDRTICIWDPNTGKRMGEPLMGHTDSVQSITYSFDGARIISGSWDKTICIWDAHTGQMLGKPLVGHANGINSVACAPDGARIVSGSADNTIRIWDAHTGHMVCTPLKGHDASVNSVTYAPDGVRIISGSNGRSICIWDAYTNLANSVAPPSAGKYLFSTIRTIGHLWSSLGDTSTPTSRKYRTRGISSVAYSPNGIHIASGSGENTICIWNVVTGQIIGKPLVGHTDIVKSITYAPDGTHIVSGSGDSTIRIWDAHTGQALGSPLKGHTGPVNSVAYSPDGAHMVSGSKDGTLRIWDVQTRRMIGGPLWGHSSGVNSVAYAPNGEHIASGSDDKTIRFWDAHSGQRIYEPPFSHTGSVDSVAYSPNGAYIAIGSGSAIHILDPHTRQMIGEPIKGWIDGIHSLAWSPDSLRIASSSNYGVIRIWDVRTRQLVGELIVSRVVCDPATPLAFSPRGSHLVSGCGDGTIRVWDPSRVHPVEGSPDGDSPKAQADDSYIIQHAAMTTPHDTSSNPGAGRYQFDHDQDDWTLIDADPHLDHHPLDHWILDDDGWVVANKSDRLVWVPPEIRAVLQPPHLITVIPQGTFVSLTLGTL